MQQLKVPGSCLSVSEEGTEPIQTYLPDQHLAIYLHFDEDDFDGNALYLRKFPDRDPDIAIKPQLKTDWSRVAALITALLPFYESGLFSIKG